jgi:mediator of RNA polymerase II transcription subunit 13
VFLVLPAAILSLSSPVLRHILSVSKKVLANYHECQILFEFVPEQHVYTGLSKTPPAFDSTLDILSASVYNRILVPVDRLRPRRVGTLEASKEDTRCYFMAPSFTLARPTNNKVSFLRAAHTPLDVMDRHTLLHVAYHLTSCGKWIIACCVDQRGENYDLGVWLTHSSGEHDGETEHSDEEYTVNKVWDFAMQFARKTNVEWRVVFAKLGDLSLPEMEGQLSFTFPQHSLLIIWMKPGMHI